MQENKFKEIELASADVPAAQHSEAAVRDEPEAKVDPVFGIHIGSLGFLVSTAKYCEVLDKIQVNPLPNIHPWVSGILNLRGNLVPVFDLRMLLEEGAGDNKKRRLFAVDRDDKALALWIDSFPEIKDRATLQALKELPSLPQLLQRFIIGAYEHQGQIWLDVKFEDLFKTLGRHQYETEEMAI
ncbi:chemotaxis protein CheW [Methyloglobulus sp.]|uniref:chemotaxis protein CheW n=1 Tax=Methyloglobulus sp. TaxID=2518622 RepID=UPI0032B78A7F